MTTESLTQPAPSLAEGVELIGVYEGSGFKDPPHLVRRADGQVIQLSQLLFLVAEAVDGSRDRSEIAALVTERFGRGVSADNVQFLVEKKLRPLGVLAAADGSSPQLQKATPLLGLKFRRALVSESATGRLAAVFRPLFWPPVLLVLLGALIAVDVWVFFSHGVAGGMRTALYSPLLLLAMLGAIVIATAYHEIGHASACRYGGARPGVLGAGVYLVWPAFYCDVTDAYRLSRAGRLRTDLGGVYFNLLFALASGALFAVTGWELLVLVILAQHTIALQQLMPLLRFDGYYVVSDLTGVPDILTRIKPIFASLVPGRETDPRVGELKHWVRVVVTAYVIVLVPALLLLLVVTVMGAPRMFATAYDSMGLQFDRIREADGVAPGLVAVLSVLALALPCLAVVISLGRAGTRVGGGVGRWAAASGRRAAFAFCATGVLLGFAAYTWWPNGDYEPLRPGERGTVGEALGAVRSIPSGRPAFSPAREAEFGSAPTERERRAPEPTATPEATATPEPTAEATETPEPSPEPTATVEATPVAEATPEVTSTVEPTVTAEPTTTPAG